MTTEVLQSTGIVAGASSVGLGVGANVGLTLYGFSASGIVAGSSAAAAQAAVGSVAAGSTFAVLQSIGMVGATALAGPAVIAGGIVGAIYLGVRSIFG